MTSPATPAGQSLAGARIGDRVFRFLLDRRRPGGTGAAGLPGLGALVGRAPGHREVRLRLPHLERLGPGRGQFGALPLIFGTLVSSTLALIIAVPLSLGVAIFLTEFAPKRMRGPVAFLIELLAAIPSVVYGLWGIFVLIPFLRATVYPFLKDTLGFLPFFQGPIYGPGCSRPR